MHYMDCNFTLNTRKLDWKLKNHKNRSDVLYSKNHNFRTATARGFIEPTKYAFLKVLYRKNKIIYEKKFFWVLLCQKINFFIPKITLNVNFSIFFHSDFKVQYRHKKKVYWTAFQRRILHQNRWINRFFTIFLPLEDVFGPRSHRNFFLDLNLIIRCLQLYFQPI